MLEWEDTGTVDNWVKLLKSQPTLNQLDATINEISIASPKFSRSQEMQVVNALLQFTVLEAFTELKNRTKAQICNILTTVIGLGNLVARIDAVELESSASTYLKLLDVILQAKTHPFSTIEPSTTTRTFLSHIISKCRSRSEVKEVERLLMKGILWGSVAQRVISDLLTFSFERTSPLANRESFIYYLCNQMVFYYEKNHQSKESLGYIGSMINCLASFASDSETLHAYFFCSDHWPIFVKLYNQMKPIDRRRHLWKILSHASKNKRSSESQGYETAVIIDELLTAPYLDGTLQNAVISTNNDHLSNIVAILISMGGLTMLNKAIRSQVSQFADPISIKREPISQQIARTYFIGALLTNAPKDYIQNILKDQGFLLGISNRLSSFSTTSKSLAVILADYACQLCDHDKIFKIEDLDGLELMFASLKMPPQKLPDIKEAWIIMSEPLIEEPIEKEYQKVPELTLQKIDLDSDDESDDDDPTIGPRKRIAKPIYIKDILNYLSVDTEDKACYDKRQLALKFAPTLIRQKASFGSEVSFYAEELLKQLVALTNFFEEKDFDSQRLNCLVSVISSCPSSATYAVELLSTGDYSLLQRITILSSLSLSARDLKGFKDDVVENSYEKKSFPSKQLPQSLHSAYMAIEDQVKSRDSSTTAIERNLQDTLMNDVSNSFKELSVGKVLRVLRTLTKKQEPKDKPVADFATIIGKYFFFPLVKTWHEVGGIDIGHYTPILVAHYIKTMSLILHCAYPTASNLSDMTQEYLVILSSLLMKINTDELQVIESIATGYLLVFDITDDENLVTYYGEMLALLQTWLSSSWEAIIDEKVKSLCAGLLLRLNSILEKNQRLVMDQINSLY